MSLKLSGYLFTGPFPIVGTTVRANQRPVVFAIIAKDGPGWAPTFRVVDVGFSEDAGISFADHPAAAQWLAAGNPAPTAYLFYAPRSEYSIEDRRKIADEVRLQYDPPNGMVAG